MAAATGGSAHLEVLGADECRARLAAQHFGRIAVIVEAAGTATDGTSRAPAHPLVVPIGYVWHDEAVWFRSGPGTTLDAALARPVAFEIDGTDARYHSGWSVVVLGRAERVTDPAHIARLDALPVPRWVPGERSCWVVIRPEQVTGRSIPAPFEPHH